MAENDSLAEGCGKERVVLGDVTNQHGKRRFSSISGGDICENVDKKENKRLVTKFVNASDKDKGKRACISPRPCSQISSLKGNVIMGVSRISTEVKDPKLLDNEVGGSVIHATAQAGDDSRGSCEDGFLRPNCVSESDCVEVICDSEEGRVGSGGSQDDSDHNTHVSGNDVDEHDVDNLVMSQTGSVDCGRLPESQESRTFELERCSGLKTDGCSNLTADIDLIKPCSCSFCTKAGYIWLDLHYQDMKARITALKKSRKDASILVERNCRNKGAGKHDQGSSNSASNLEHDLMTQWRSLFSQMEGIFEREVKEHEISLASIKDLRDKCKTDLEVINGQAPDSQ